MKLVMSLAISFMGLSILLFQNCAGQHQSTMSSEDELAAAAAALDSKYLNALINDSRLSLVIKNAFREKNIQPFFTDASSVILLLERGQTGEIFALRSSVGGEESRVSVVDGMIYAIHASDLASSSSRSGPLPPGDGPIVVAASFGVDETDIQLLINGVVQTEQKNIVKTPTDFNYLMKEWNFARAPKQALVYGRALSAAELNVVSRLMGQELQLTSVVYDPRVLQPITPVATDSPKFLAAKAIIDSRCVSCHSTASLGDYRQLSEEQFVTRGWVSRGSTANSKIYSRLTGALSGAGPRNMPASGSALTSAEVKAIGDWITGL